MADNPFAGMVEGDDVRLNTSYNVPETREGMGQLVNFSPESMDQINQQELNPNNDIELDKEISNAKDPKIKASLLAEKERRKNLTGNPFAEMSKEDNPFSKMTASDDLEPLGKYDFVTPALNKVKNAGYALADSPGKFLKGVARSVGDIAQQTAVSAGDLALQGMSAENPLIGGIARLLIKPDLKPGISGIAEDMERQTKNVDSMISSETLNSPEFQSGRGLASVPFDLLGITKGIESLPKKGQDIANVAMGVAPFFLGMRGGKAKVKAETDIPKPTDKQVIDDLLGKKPTQTLDPNEPFVVNSDGIAMREGDVAGVNAARDLRHAQEEAARKETLGEEASSQPARDPNKPIYVDTNGHVIAEGTDQFTAFDAARREYEAAKAKADELPEGTIPYTPDEIVRGDDPTARADFRTAQRSGTRPATPFRDRINPAYEGGIDFENFGIPKPERTGRPNPIPEGEPIAVDSQGAAVPNHLMGLYEKAKASLEAEMAAKATELTRGKQGELGLEPASTRLFPDQPDLLRDGKNVGDLSPRPPLEDRPGTQRELNLQPDSASVPVYEKPGTIFDPENVRRTARLKRQGGEGEIFNDLARGIYDAAVGVGSLVKDITGRIGRVIGEDRNGYRIRTEVEGGAIYSTLPKANKDFRLGEEVRLSDNRKGTVRAIQGDTVKVAIPRDGGFDLVNVPKEKATLMDSPTQLLSRQAGHGEMFNDFAELMAKGLDALRDKYKKMKDVGNVKITYDPQSLRDVVRTSLVNSQTFKGFMNRLEMAGVSDDVLNSAGELWASKEDVIANAGQSKFSQLSKSDQKQADDVNTDYTTKRNELGYSEENKPTQDIGKISRLTATAQAQKLLHSNKDVGPMLSWVISNGNKIIGDGIHMYKILNKGLDSYHRLSRKEQGHFTQTLIDFDGTDNTILKDQGLQWATDDMLRQKGFNDKQIRAYHDLTKMMDSAWDILEMTFRDQGREPPKRIPGYFPHIWHGSYKVLFRNAEGNVVRMKAFSTYFQAKAYDKWMRKDNELGLKSEIVVPKDDPHTVNMIADLMDALKLDDSRSLDKALVEKIKRHEDFAMRGIVTELLERKANMGGHMAEDGVKPFTTLSFKHNSRLMNIYDKYVQDLSNYYAHSRIVSEVQAPFMADRAKGIYDNVPEFVHTVEEYIARATGHPVNHTKLVDSTLRGIGRMMGLPPTAINTMVRSGGQVLYFNKLIAGNVTYFASQILQPMTMGFKISLAHTERLMRGDKTGDVFGSLAYGLKELASIRQGHSTPETKAVLKFMQNKGILDSRQIDNVDPSDFVRKTTKLASVGIESSLEHLEVHNRTALALMYYRYFKNAGMPQMEAIRAAATQMNLSMGDYTKASLPGMYTDLGYVGQWMRPFATLKNTYLGEGYRSLQVIADGVKAVKEGTINPAILPMALMPMAAWTLSSIFFAGIAGAVGYKEIDLAIKLVNLFRNDDNQIADLGTMLRSFGVDSPMLYGLLGSNLPGKPNIGPSINAPAITDMGAIPGPQALWHEGLLAKEGVKYIMGKPVDWEQVNESGQRLAPGWLGQKLAGWIGEHQGGNVPSATASFTKNTFHRTPEQQKIAEITGRANIDEQDVRDREKLYTYNKQKDEQWATQQAHLLTNILEKYPSGPTLEEAVNKIIAQKRGVGDEIIDKIIQMHIDRMMDTPTRNLMGLANADGAKLARLKELYDMLHGK